ncbi:MAG: hypothetical protein CMN85_03085 [Spongiibacteraceae bacterium]|nr:hypothetical protein [Spongiibacteraceae bacterium]
MATQTSIDNTAAGLNTFVEVLGGLSHESILMLFCALTLAALGLLMWQKRLHEEQKQHRERQSRMECLTRASQAQSLLLEQTLERMQTLEAYVDLLSGKQQQLLTTNTVRKHRLQDAIECAGSGMNKQEIARRAGVGSSEARLIGELYGIHVA